MRTTMPSRLAIAKAAALSEATVSLALNNHPRVSERTKRRVADLASRMGYVPNQAARRLAGGTQSSRVFDQVAFVLLKKFDIELEGPYLAMMLGVEHQLSSLGASTVFLRVGSEDDHDKVRRVMRAGAVDGFFLVGEVNEEALQLVQFPHRPCVVLGGNRCRQPVHSVDINFTMASRLAVEHLASLGHRRIGYLGGGTDFPYQNDQLEGFVTAVRELGLDSDPDLIRLRRSDEGPPVMERVRSLLALRPLPTAIITSDPTYSVIALDLLKQYELSVPSEISLLGFQLDNKTGSVPGITRIEFPFRAVGRAGGSLLRDIVSQPDTPPRQIQISPRLVEGWSCGRLPQSRQAR